MEDFVDLVSSEDPEAVATPIKPRVGRRMARVARREEKKSVIERFGRDQWSASERMRKYGASAFYSAPALEGYLHIDRGSDSD